jgi:hypothetical protein
MYLFSDVLDNKEEKPYCQPDFSNKTTLVARNLRTINLIYLIILFF